MMIDTAGAFCPHGKFKLTGASTGPLAGSTFAVKDLFDIEGYVTGAGNPEWLATHAAADQTAPPVTALLAAGARMIGKTITDELAYSLNGDNIHYGTPRNSRAPDRVPGGSSSGSAAAVAAGLCDFALGTDTGGSVRIPASFCGVFGIRTTHGAISVKGLLPLMPSFDTVGWFAREADLFARVGGVLLPESTPTPLPRRLLIVSDALEITDREAVSRIRNAIDVLRHLFSEVGTVSVAGREGLVPWRDAFRIASAHETWQVHGKWISAHSASLSAPVAERFAFARSVTTDVATKARRKCQEFGSRVRALVGVDTVICIPTAPGPAPKLDAKGQTIEEFRQRTQRLTSIAGLSGLPEVSVPDLIDIGGLPLGLSFIGSVGSDRTLLALAEKMSPAYQ
jgi:amidase